MAINPRPSLRVRQLWGIEEPASSLFCLIMTIMYSITLFRFLSIWRVSRGPAKLNATLCLLCIVVFGISNLSATLFHIHETRLNMIMDYFGAATSILVSAVWALTKALRIRRWTVVLLISMPLVVLAVRHFASMIFVKFDFGGHMDFCIKIGVGHFVVWIVWLARNWRVLEHKWWLIWTHVFLVMGLFFEMVDFKPIWKTFDAHSLWHFFGIFSSLCYIKFIFADVSRDFEDDRKLKP